MDPQRRKVASTSKLLDPRPGAGGPPPLSAFVVVAAQANRALHAFYYGGKTRHDQSASVKMPPAFAAIALMSAADAVEAGKCKLAPDAEVYFLCEKRNRAVRLLCGSVLMDATSADHGYLCKPRQPWTFVWTAELVQNRIRALSKVSQAADEKTGLIMAAFPLQRSVLPGSDGHSELVGKFVNPIDAAGWTSFVEASLGLVKFTFVIDVVCCFPGASMFSSLGSHWPR